MVRPALVKKRLWSGVNKTRESRKADASAEAAQLNPFHKVMKEISLINVV